MFGTAFSKRHPEVGARPGTLVPSDAALAPRIRLISYGSGGVEEKEITDVSELQDAMHDQTLTWIDVQGFGDLSEIRKIGEIFEFHPLLLEDVVNAPQRPKTESYTDQLLVIVRMVLLDDAHAIQMEQVSIVKGNHYVITFQEKYGDVLDPIRERIRKRKTLIHQHGADYLTYAIMDTIVDGYYPILEQIGDRIESLEHHVITNPSPKLLGKLHRLKNHLVNLRRGIWPQREAVNALVRGDHAGITDEVQIFLRDTYDHCAQTSEVCEMYREMVTGLMNTYLTSVANRTNEVMKVLTIVATIFIPLTFMAGIYGMNFEHMPELHVKWAYPAFWIALVVVASTMVAFFVRRGWIQFGIPKASSRQAKRQM